MVWEWETVGGQVIWEALVIISGRRDVCRCRREENGDFTSWTSLELSYLEEETESGEDGGRGWTEEGVFLDSLVGCSGSYWKVSQLVLFPGKCGVSWIVLFAGKVGVAQTVLAAGKGRVSYIVLYLLLWECRSRDGSLGAWMLWVFLGGRSWRFGRFEVIPDTEVDILFVLARGTAFIGWTRDFVGAKSVGGKLIIWLYFPSGTGTWCRLEMATSGILGNCFRFFLWMVLQACFVNSLVTLTLPNHWQAATGHFIGHCAVGS